MGEDERVNMFGIPVGPQGKAGFKDDGSPPFRPFGPGEVCAITGVDPKVLDAWMSNVLPVRAAEDDPGLTGLDWMQTFGVYAGWRWLKEGAGLARASRVLGFCAGLTTDALAALIKEGNTWPPHVPGSPPVATRPPRSHPRMARELNLKTLYDGYLAELRRVFPNG